MSYERIIRRFSSAYIKVHFGIPNTVILSGVILTRKLCSSHSWLTRDLLHDPLDGCLGEGGPAEHLVPVELPLREVGDEYLHPLALLLLTFQPLPLLQLATLLFRKGLLRLTEIIESFFSIVFPLLMTLSIHFNIS